MPIYRVTPLMPAYLLSLGAVLILAVGPALAPRRRHGLAVATSGLAAISLFFVSSGYPADVQLVRVLVEWLGDPALVLRVPLFEPFLWVLILSLLAISLGEWGATDRLSPLDQAMTFALTAAACGVVLAGNYRTLAFTLLLFDGTAALVALTNRRPGQAVGRLLLGTLSSTAVILVAQGTDHLISQPLDLDGLFSLTLWLRLGLYPLVESTASSDSRPPMRLVWIIANLAVGLYLASSDVATWVAWLAGATTALHGALAWLEPGRERALAHTGYALGGGILTLAAVMGGGVGVVAASVGALAALVTLDLTSPRLGRPDWSRPWRLWAYLPPLLAMASLVGVPFTLGWEGRGTLYRMTWDAGATGALALAVVAEGAALSVLYRYCLHLAAPVGEHGGLGQAEGGAWRPLGATLAAVPFLIPVVGPRVLSVAAPSVSAGTALGPDPLGTSLGLVGSLLWAIFLGYGRRRLLDTIPVSHDTLISALRLSWLLQSLGQALDTLGRVLLRIRAVIEGEHYLAWAILLALSLGLMIVLR